MLGRLDFYRLFKRSSSENYIIAQKRPQQYFISPPND
jgi:ribosomal protein S21